MFYHLYEGKVTDKNFAVHLIDSIILIFTFAMSILCQFN